MYRGTGISHHNFKDEVCVKEKKIRKLEVVPQFRFWLHIRFKKILCKTNIGI